MLLILLSLPGFTQSTEGITPSEINTYCIVSKSYKHGKIDKGDGTKEKIIVDDEGVAITFKSSAELLNYMSKKGWKLEQMIIKAATSKSSISENIETDHTYLYLMSKKILAEIDDTDIKTKD